MAISFAKKITKYKTQTNTQFKFNKTINLSAKTLPLVQHHSQTRNEGNKPHLVEKPQSLEQK